MTASPEPPPPPLASERLRHRFAPHVRERGLRYHLQGAVRITAADAAGITAAVQGTRRYMVALGFDGDALEVSCTCPAFGAGPCKHIWATILSAERSGLLDSRRTGPLVDLAADPGLPPASEGYDDLGYGPSYDAKGKSRAVLGSLPRRESWRDRLDLAARTVAPAIAPEPPGSQIVYVVDVPATLAGGVLAVEVARRRQSKAGVWGAPGALRLSPDAIPLLPEPADRELLALLVGAQDSPYRFAGGNAATLYRLHNGLDQLLVPRLCASGRCLLRRDSDSPLSTLAWDPGEPWEFWLEMRADDGHYAVDGSLRRGAERRPLGEPHLIVDRLVFFEGLAAPFDHAHSMAILADLRRRGVIKVPRPQALPALERLLRRRDRPRIALDPELRLEESQGVPSPHLIVKASPNDWSDRLPCTLSFDYAGTLVPATDPAWCVPKMAERRLLIRDLALETAAAERLQLLGFRRTPSSVRGPGPLQLSPRHLARAVRTLLAESWHVEAEGKVYRSAGAVRMEVVSGIDWFDLKGDVKFAEASVPLPAVLAALRRGETTITLGDGTVGMLPEEWLKRYGLLASLGSPEQGAMRFRRSQAALLDALLAAQPDVVQDEGFTQARQALRAFDGIRPADQPKGFVGQLREYQRQGLGWLSFLERFGFGGCLADDMGLGKTIQVLALFETRRGGTQGKERRPSLVVVPRSLVFNWKDEAARFAPRLRILDHTGPGRAKDAKAFAEVDLVLTTYGTLRRDMLLLKDVEFDYVVLDEAQAVKNMATVSAKAVRLLKARQRLALSGTPIENHLGELWSLFEFLNPGMLGRSGPFQNRAGNGLDESERAVLGQALRPFILRRTKGEVARDLPPKVEQTVHCELEAPQRKLYDELRDHYRGSLISRIERDGIGRSKIHVLEALLRLRQAACHPGLIDPKRDRRPLREARLSPAAPRRGPRRRAQGARLLAVHELPRDRAPEARRARVCLRVPRWPDARPRRARAPFPGADRAGPLLDQPEGGWARPEPDRGRVRVPARSLVEPGGRGAGHRPHSPHRPEPTRLRLSPDREGHGGGEGARAPGEQARPRRRPARRRQEPDRRAAARRPRAAPLVTKREPRTAPLDRWFQRVFDDNAPSRLGTGWASGVVSVFLGSLALGAVLVLRFPSWLSTARFRALYPLPLLRAVIEGVIVLAFVAGVASLLLRRRKVLGLTGCAFSLAAAILGGGSVAVAAEVKSTATLGLDWFLLNLLLLALLFVPLERLFPMRAGQSTFRPEWTTDGVYFLVSHALVQALSFFILLPATALGRVFHPAGLQAAIGSQPFLVQVLEIVLVADLAQYVVHRAFHQVPALWPFHAIHHSSRDLDWLAGSRLHLLDAVATRALVLVPLSVLGFAESALAAYLGVRVLPCRLHSRERPLPAESTRTGPRHSPVSPLAPRRGARSPRSQFRGPLAVARSAVRHGLFPRGGLAFGVRPRGRRRAPWLFAPARVPVHAAAALEPDVGMRLDIEVTSRS